MATYKTSELLKQIGEIINDGYEYVEVDELKADDEIPASLSFEAIGEFETIGYDGVDSCEASEDYDFDAPFFKFSPDDLCGNIAFTFNEIFTIKLAIDNALEYMKECSKDTSCSKELLSQMKEDAIDYRNLQAKLAKFLKHIKPH